MSVIVSCLILNSEKLTTDVYKGHETTTIAGKWALYLIGLYPEVQEKIHQELDSVLGAVSKDPLSVADLNEFKYLECVLKVRFNIKSRVANEWNFLEYLELFCSKTERPVREARDRETKSYQFWRPLL
ncbi:hypothetical protein CEXT_766441 [Caerostris extrusa]|uniref:Cytochrome P450 n=1 Tax=Caerostris extrusa TaxID=172846 RepID=A0AAV4UD68_CAEEX|nr:hypothetical protein CEXT_766441 [Caerostris extrusa]